MYDVSCVYVYAHVAACASVVCVCVQYECVYMYVLCMYVSMVYIVCMYMIDRCINDVICVCVVYVIST